MSRQTACAWNFVACATKFRGPKPNFGQTSDILDVGPAKFGARRARPRHPYSSVDHSRYQLAKEIDRRFEVIDDDSYVVQPFKRHVSNLQGGVCSDNEPWAAIARMGD